MANKLTKNKKRLNRCLRYKKGKCVARHTKKQNIRGKVYFTHDNGGRPFMVIVNGKNIDIYKVSKDFDYSNSLTKKNYTEFIKSYKNVKRIFIGKSVKGDDAYASFPNNSSAAAKFGLGNSILLQISTNRYAFIGESVYEFETPDLIEEYYSMIGGNDVPYPIAVGSKNVYFLIFGGNDGYLSKKYFEDFPQKHSWALDSYARLWGQNKFTDSLIKYTKKIPKIKIVQKRD